jgi:hypothetical protein
LPLFGFESTAPLAVFAKIGDKSFVAEWNRNVLNTRAQRQAFFLAKGLVRSGGTAACNAESREQASACCHSSNENCRERTRANFVLMAGPT